MVGRVVVLVPPRVAELLHVGEEARSLGWRHLVQRLVDAGLLVRVTGHELSTSYGFHILWPKGKDLSPQARRVRDWMAEEAAKAQADAARSIPPAQKSINVPR